MRFYYVKDVGGSASSYIDDWVSHRYLHLRITGGTEYRRMSDDFILNGLDSYGKQGSWTVHAVPDLLVILLLGADHI